MNIDSYRLATESDSDAITALVNAAYRPNSKIKGWTHEADLVSGERTSGQRIEGMMARPRSVFLIGISDSKIAASVHVEMKMGICHIGMLAVNPLHQTGGFGKAMLAYAENYGVNHFEVQKFHLTVVSSRIELISFYLRRGYQRTGITMKYPMGTGTGEPKFSDLMVEILEKLPHASNSSQANNS
jgi:ribosomal protein S18 acetylase RimI-like enzyme